MLRLDRRRDEILGHVPDWLRDPLESSGLPWGVCGGTVRDVLRGVAPRDVDVISFLSTRRLLALMADLHPNAQVKGPYTAGGRGKTPIPMAEWRAKSDVEPLVILVQGVELWSCLEYGWTRPPDGRVVEFDFTCNAMAVWNTGHLSADSADIDHVEAGRMAVVNSPRALRPHRQAHMENKGFVLVP